jgi:acetyltransferase-like isoleucine patch superfamily enzyme
VLETNVAVRLLKGMAMYASFVCVLPIYALYVASAAVLGPDKAFQGYSQGMSLLPGLVGQYVRRAFYRLVLPQCGSDACISFGTVFSHRTARLGSKVYTGAYCVLGDVTLEPDVLLGSRVSIINGSRQHGIARLDVPIREQPGLWTHITIGRDAWIGDGAIVMADVGRHAVVGAGSVVTRRIPDCAIAAGNPARVLRFREGANVESPAALHDIGGPSP